MSVVIDQIEAEVGDAAPPQRSAGASAGAPAAAQAPDLDRLEFHIERRRHRAERLRAD